MTAQRLAEIIEMVECLEQRGCTCDDREGFTCGMHDTADKIKEALTQDCT